MRRRWKLPALLAAPALLLLAVGAQAFFRGAPGAGADLPADLLPAAFPGWRVENLRYAERADVAAAIEENIGYHDYVYRRYTRGDVEIVVDLTHWLPKQRHFLDVGMHVPDNCWVAAGMRLEKKAAPLTLRLADGRALKPAEARVFANGAREFYTACWHLIGEGRVDYARYGTGRTLAFVWDNLRFFHDGAGEQFFLNLNSNVPLERLEREPLWREILERLARFLPLAEP
ncbi:MAG: hypothetical protein LBR12_02230 [Opitutaceae bacterium]|jgi:hypothetical protein|nr:hypothetical protein [Opitutaceae bacterium]